ncbi:MAG: CoA ester lyase [Pseudomonadota bacterium]
MPDLSRPRRSVLYMPGSRARALDKARSLPADALILDLEDAVALAEKAEARRLVADALATGGYGKRELIVRINGFDTEWGEADLEMVAVSSADAVLVPKVEDPATVQHVAHRLDALGADADLAIWAMMETPMGMLRAAEIAAAHPRLACFVLGTNDLVKDLQAEHTPNRLPVVTALGLCALAARAHGLAILDGVYNAIRDDKGLAESCAQGRAFGFDGKTLIHPSQIESTNRIFAPSEADLELSKRYVAAFNEAEAAGRGVAVVDGKLVENLHVENARRQLAQAELIAELEAAHHASPAA